MSQDCRKAAMTLKAHHLIAEIWAKVDLSSLPLSWSAFHRQFTAIVNLGAATLQDGNPLDSDEVSDRTDGWNTCTVLMRPTSALLPGNLSIAEPLREVSKPHDYDTWAHLTVTVASR